MVIFKNKYKINIKSIQWTLFHDPNVNEHYVLGEWLYDLWEARSS